MRHASAVGLSLLVLAAAVPANATASKSATPAKAAATGVTPHAKAVGAAGLLAAAQRQLDSGNFAAAIEYANSAVAKAPLLEDYAHWVRAQAEYRSKNYEEVSKSVTHVFNQQPLSPFVGPAAALAVRSYLDNDKPKEALELIRKYYDQIPEPQGDLLLAQCFAASGDLAQAAEYNQRVYYEYPVSKEATDAANALVDLKQRLGDAYPPLMPASMIERAQKLFDAHNPGAAKIELAAAVDQLGGRDRDLARVRLGVADYLANNTAAAFQYLSALKVDDPETDAERLSYLLRASRKLDRHADVKPFLDDLEKLHPTSPWRLDGLIFVADQARVDNDSGTALPLYRACASTFPGQSRAAWCHWQIAFDSYRKDAADAYDLLRAQLTEYPGSDDVNDALYFLGRLSERKQDPAAARACYEQLISRFPNTYFAMQARDRLKDTQVAAATSSPTTAQFLKDVQWPDLPQFPSFAPGKLAETRINRSELLQTAGLNDLAEGELKFGAHNDGDQENVYAFALAKLASARGAEDQAMRYVKRFAPGYLYMPLDQAPAQFWKLAFPIPYRPSIEQYSHSENLDPFLVAALIRQESEFNAKVVSPAKAYGLMQLLPTTGKELARHYKIRRFSASQLLVGDRNVQLGTLYFRNMLNSYNGQTELALASYNAGPGRVNVWRNWGPFREQAEFIEAVPFHETRGYVQIVLRNADVYRRLYANTTPDLPVYHPKPPPKTRTKPKRKRTHPH